MKNYLYFVLWMSIYGCYPDSGNSPYPVAPLKDDPKPETGSGDSEPSENSPGTSIGGETNRPPEPACPNALPSDESIFEHNMDVQYSPSSDTYTIFFTGKDGPFIPVVSLYITDENAEVPTFTNGFQLKGTPYWLLSVDDPFETSIQLPIQYGQVVAPAIDITADYDGSIGGTPLQDLASGSCIKITVISFEEDKDPAFRTSTHFYQL